VPVPLTVHLSVHQFVPAVTPIVYRRPVKLCRRPAQKVKMTSAADQAAVPAAVQALVPALWQVRAPFPAFALTVAVNRAVLRRLPVRRALQTIRSKPPSLRRRYYPLNYSP
jgi:hypothetical protein